MGSPFNRAHMMMSILAAAVAGMAPGSVQYQQAFSTAAAQVGPYQSRGKRKTKGHDQGGTAIVKRLARKRKNVVRNRKAHRRAA